MSSKSIFLFGLTGGFLVVCTIGFIVLLGLVLSKGALSSTKTGNINNQPSNVANLNQNNNKAAQVQPSDSNDSSSIKLATIKSTDHIRGGKDAKVTIVEFSDSECPFCKRFHSTMLQVMKEYGDKVKWVYKHAPLDSLHQNARKESEAMECAAELGGNDGFWKYADRLYDITTSNDGLDASKLPEIAQYVGLDKSKFSKCLSSGKYANLVQIHLNEAQTAGMQGTPYSVIFSGDQKIPVSGAYPFSEIKKMIDSLL